MTVEQKNTLHEAHTGDKAPSNVVGSLGNAFSFVAKSTMTNSPDLWSVGHADIITLMEDGSVRHNGSWKYRPEGRNDANVHELHRALTNLKNTRAKVQGCSGL